MKILFRFSAMFLGTIALLFGSNSCNSDEEGAECCTTTLTYDGYSYTIKACKDGELTYSYTDDNGDSYTYTYNWITEGEDYTWSYIKSELCETSEKKSIFKN